MAMKATKAMKAAKAMKATKCPKAMKAAECSKVAKAMKAAKCSKAMKAAECSQAAEAMKAAKWSKATRRWKSLPATKDCEKHAKFCDDESFEKDCYAIKDPTEHVEALGATITDATAEWEAIPLQVFFKNGRVKFKYIWLETEPAPVL